MTLTLKRAFASKQKQTRLHNTPGSSGDYYRIVVRPDRNFISFRIQDVGRSGLLRVAGRRRNGSWATQAWVINKDRVRMVGDRLEPTDDDAHKLFEQFRVVPRRQAGNLYSARERSRIPRSFRGIDALRRPLHQTTNQPRVAWCIMQAAA